MTHSQDRAHWFKEGAIGLGVGVLYGVTSVCVGHPFDTMKSKMQAQTGFEKGGMIKTMIKTFRKQGLIGFYRGSIPVLWGSGIYRSTQFGVFESVYTYLDNPACKYELPFTGGLQVRVLIAGACGSTARAIIESPLELAKIRRQTQQTWQFRGLYKGFGVMWCRTMGLMCTCFILVDTLRRHFPNTFKTSFIGPFLVAGCASTGFGVMWCRTMGLMCTYFILVDTQRRHFPNAFKTSFIGPFLVSGCAATLAWWIVWPLEYMKSQVQANYGKDLPVLARMRLVIRERGGFLALYRGLGPGTIRSFISNGTSMVVMANAQRKVSEWGLRD